MTWVFPFFVTVVILAMMGAISALLGRNNGRGIVWNFVAGAFFGPFAWVSVPYLRPRPKHRTDHLRDVVAEEATDDNNSGEESRSYDEEPELELDPGDGSSDQRKIIRNCILLFLGIWIALEVIERLT